MNGKGLANCFLSMYLLLTYWNFDLYILVFSSLSLILYNVIYRLIFQMNEMSCFTTVIKQNNFVKA